MARTNHALVSNAPGRARREAMSTRRAIAVVVPEAAHDRSDQRGSSAIPTAIHSLKTACADEPPTGALLEPS